VSDASPGPVRIVFVVQMPVSARDFRRFHFAELTHAGASVAVLDVSSIVMRGIDHDRSHYRNFQAIDISVVDDKQDLPRHQVVLDEADLIVCHVGGGFLYPENHAVLRLVSKSTAPYVVFSNNAIPSWNREAKAPPIMGRLLGKRPWVTALNRLPLGAIGIRRADYVIYGGSGSRIPMRLIGPETEAIWAHCNDYLLFQKLVDHGEMRETEATAVFIDQNLGFHPGADASGFRQAVTVSEFYPRLRRLFDRLE